MLVSLTPCQACSQCFIYILTTPGGVHELCFTQKDLNLERLVLSSPVPGIVGAQATCVPSGLRVGACSGCRCWNFPRHTWRPLVWLPAPPRGLMSFVSRRPAVPAVVLPSVCCQLPTPGFEGCLCRPSDSGADEHIQVRLWQPFISQSFVAHLLCAGLRATRRGDEEAISSGLKGLSRKGP